MFQLLDQQQRPVCMKSGKPFIYTSRALANIGRFLLRERGVRLTVADVEYYIPLRGPARGRSAAILAEATRRLG